MAKKSRERASVLVSVTVWVADLQERHRCSLLQTQRPTPR